jgi:molybdopterin converting factor small subunit
LSSTEQITVGTVKVKLIGVLGSAAGQREIFLEWSDSLTVSTLIENLLKKVSNAQFKDFLVDSGTNDPRPNVIILVDEQDMNIYQGLKTKLDKDTTITIIPVAHGG